MILNMQTITWTAWRKQLGITLEIHITKEVPYLDNYQNPLQTMFFLTNVIKVKIV